MTGYDRLFWKKGGLGNRPARESQSGSAGESRRLSGGQSELCGLRRSIFLHPLPPCTVQPSPATVPRRAGRRTGPRRARGLAGRAAIPLHAHDQVPALVHAQQYLGHLPRAAGVLDRHPAAGAGIRQSPRPAALRAEHGHAHAVLPPAIASHPGIQRHASIEHIHSVLPSPPRIMSGRRLSTHGVISSICHWKALRSD